MSSSPLTDLPADRPARWRSPAGWPLRTRIVAILIVLLTALGLAVGTTAEIFLRQQLYNQLDTKLNQILHPIRPNGSGNGNGNGPEDDPNPGWIPKFDKGAPPFGGTELGTIQIVYTDAAHVEGGLVIPKTDAEGNYSGTTMRKLTGSNLATVLAVKPDGSKTDISLGDYGSFRVVGDTTGDGRTRIVALPL